MSDSVIRLFNNFQAEFTGKQKELFNGYHKMLKRIIQKSYIPKPYVMESLFFPSLENEKTLMGYLQKAKRSLDVCVYCITNHNLINALEEAHKKKVRVRIITNELMSLSYTNKYPIYQLVMNGITIRLDKNGEKMHNKFVIIDDYIVITGSFNWTKQAAEKNKENVLLLQDEKLLSQYKDEFSKLWASFEQQQITFEAAAAIIEKSKPSQPKKSYKSHDAENEYQGEYSYHIDALSNKIIHLFHFYA